MSSSVLKRNPCKRSPALSLQGLQAIIGSARSAQRIYVKSKWAVLGIFLQIHHKFTAHFLNGSVKSKRHGRAVPLPETHTLQKDYALVKRLFTGIRHIGLLIYMHFCVTSRRFLLHYLIPGTTILKDLPSATINPDLHLCLVPLSSADRSKARQFRWEQQASYPANGPFAPHHPPPGFSTPSAAAAGSSTSTASLFVRKINTEVASEATGDRQTGFLATQ